MRHRFVEGAAGEAERRRADGRAEDVERRHRHLEPLAGCAEPVLPVTRQRSKTEAGEGVRRNRCDPLGDEEPRCVGADDEGRESSRAGRFAGAGEDDVPVGDAAVGDVGLLAVEEDMPAVARCDRRDRGDVGARRRFGEGEGGDRLPRRHVGQPASLLLGRAEERDRPAAEALEREGEVGEAVMIGERLAREAEGPHVEPRAGFRDDRRRKQTLLAQAPRPAAGTTRRRRRGRQDRPRSRR